MRPIMFMLIASALVVPRAFAQAPVDDTARVAATAAAASTPPPASMTKAHRAMASFTSLLREAALQSQARRAATSTPVATQASRAPTDQAAAATAAADTLR